jgi:putative iron-dependent peroxidase
MGTPQMGIFALGTSAHCYLELATAPGVGGTELVRALAALDEPRSTVGGANLVVGFRPSLWAAAAPATAVPEGVSGFDQPVSGVEGFSMPATQQDAWLWVAGHATDLVFDVCSTALDALKDVAGLATEVTGWAYRDSRDLTGFEDGTENPPLAEAVPVVAVPDGAPGAGSTVVLVQQWAHDRAAWASLDVEVQERTMGRTKPDSIELAEEVMPADSHVSRTVIEDADGVELAIFRRNTPYGSVSDHGTMFVGFSREQARLHRMLLRMAGAEDGIRDALTRFTTPLTGAYYVVPSIEDLAAFAPPTSD